MRDITGIMIGAAIIIVPMVWVIVDIIRGGRSTGVDSEDEHSSFIIDEMKEVIGAYEAKELSSHQFNVAMKYLINK